MEKGKWIFLVNKLPTVVSPPAMSIHYAIPWPMEDKRMDEVIGKQLKKFRSLLEECKYVGKNELEKQLEHLFIALYFQQHCVIAKLYCKKH